MRLGDKLGLENAPNARLVSSFKEKPDARTAAAYIATGSYRWNAGMFVTKASLLMELMREYKDQIDAPTVDIYTKAALVAEWATLLWKAKNQAEEARAVFMKNVSDAMKVRKVLFDLLEISEIALKVSIFGIPLVALYIRATLSMLPVTKNVPSGDHAKSYISDPLLDLHIVLTLQCSKSSSPSSPKLV